MTASIPELVSLPGGTFRMGNDGGRPDERPAHMVTISAFRAAISPVSNAQYAAYVAVTGAAPAPFVSEERFAEPDQPAVGINWYEAVAYCDWLRSVSGIAYRLPTEAEREYAALGGLSGVAWPWTTRPDAFVEAINAMTRPHAPGSACANGYGLRCMAENVHEWCSDWYARDYYAESPGHDPIGPVDGKRRASRGGSWRHKEKLTAINARSSLDPSLHYSDFGFRVYAQGLVPYDGCMGEVTVRVKLSNLIDIERAAAGEQVSLRSVEVEAVVDTGAIRSVIPERVARALGLRIVPGRPVGLADGSVVVANRAQGLVLEILGRDTQEEALVLGDEVLIGQTTLEATDLVVDCGNRTVYPNPANPGWIMKVRRTMR